MSFKIKNLNIEGRVILAPMAGITSFSYRKLFEGLGVSLFYTEMISDCGLIYKNKKTLDMIKSDGSDNPLALQLFGGKKETLLEAIDVLEEVNANYDILDLNLACPVPKVTKNNGGSTWLKDLDSLKDMVSAVCKKSKKPVSAKIRLGYDKINVYEVCKVLEEGGISFIAIHCRTKNELYSGEPHYEEIKDLKKYIKIPFAVSGNIFTIEGAKKALEITKADAVLVARGGIGNPNFVINLHRLFDLNSSELKINSIDEQITYLKKYINLLIEEVGKKRATSILKGIAPKFFLSFNEAKTLRKEISQNITSTEDLIKIIDNYQQSIKNE